MAALNFPDPNVTTSYTNPDTGITYEWSNGIWKAVRTAQTAPELFVDADGDNLTGNLTLGTDKIVLNATDGSATFAGAIKTTATNNAFYASAGYSGGEAAIRVENTNAGGNPYYLYCDSSDGNIAYIKTDGSASFAGDVTVENVPSPTIRIIGTGQGTALFGQGWDRSPGGNTGAVIAADNGPIVFRRGVAYNGDPGDTALGTTAMFIHQDTGNVHIGGDIDTDVTNRNIELMSDGSAEFAGGINAAHLIGVSPDARRAGVNPLSDTGPFYFVGTDGNVKFKVAQSGGIAISNVNTETNPKTSLSSDGSATFAGGDVNIDIDGRVGVGTSSPSKRLELNYIESANHSSSSGSYEVLIWNKANSSSYPTLSAGIQLRAGHSNAGAGSIHGIRKGPANQGELAFVTTNAAGNNVEAMRIDSEGNVGIGTQSPTALLQVGSYAGNNGIQIGAGSGSTSYIHFGDAASGLGEFAGYVQYTHSTNALQFGTDSQEAMRIDADGRLLVGTTSFTGEASAVLEGSSAGETTQAQLWLNRGQANPTTDNVLGQIIFGDATASGRNGAMIQARVDSSWSGVNGNPTRLAFFTEQQGSDSGTKERMRITNIGNTIFAESSTAGGSANFINNNDVGFSADGGYGQQLKMGNTYGGGKGYVLFHYNSTSAVIGAIIAAGSSGGTATGVLYNTTSDYRLKENVVTLTEAIDRVKHLKPSRFNFIADPNRTVDGFLAHEAQTVVPEAVTGTHDEVDDDGNAVMQGIDQSKLVPLLTAALQEAIAKIETLEQRLSDAGIA